MIIKAKAYPRAGLVGNPSDGFYGKTIAFSFCNFAAEVILYESPELEILPCLQDQSTFDSVSSLVRDVELHGYYGGIRLLKATIKRFHDYCQANNIVLDNRNFTIRYKTNIPHGVGLAGSSAIITACMRALMTFYGVNIPKSTQANLILSCEVNELNIAAGLQDRVVQVYEGCVFMDFDKKLMDSQGYGCYESLPLDLLPNLYVAYREDLSSESGSVHNNVRERFELGDKTIHDAMKYWASLTSKAKDAITAGNHTELNDIINANFDKRKQIYNITEDNLDMVKSARSVGASAKFSGSGGAIVGIYKDEKMFKALKTSLDKIGIKIIKPKLKQPSKTCKL